MSGRNKTSGSIKGGKFIDQ